MTKTLDSGQQALVERATQAVVTLARIQLFADREAEAVGQVLYAATRPVLYDYGDTGTPLLFWPILGPLEGFRESIDHLPSPATLGELDRRVTLHLANVEVAGDRVSETLRSSYALENARVQVAQIRVDPEQLPPDGRLLDLEAAGFVGTEHDVVVDGRIRRVGPITSDRVELEVQSELPSFPWVYPTGAGIDPKDLGLRLPVVYGEARVRCLGTSVGWATTLAQAITSSQTGVVQVSDVSGLPEGSLTLRIGTEEVTASKTSDTTINVTARGTGGTTAIGHGRGEIVLEQVSSVVFTAAAHAVDAISAVYFRNPATGALVRIPSGFTVDLADTSEVPGETVATITFTSAQLKSILDELYGAIETASSIDNDEVFVPFASRAQGTDASGGDLSNLGAAIPRFDGDGGSHNETLRVWIPTSANLAPRKVNRWKLRVTFNGASGNNLNPSRLRVRTEDVPGFTNDVDHIDFTIPNNSEVIGAVAESVWETPPANTTLDDLESAGPTGDQYAFLWHSVVSGTAPPAGDYLEIVMADSGFVAEIDPDLSVETALSGAVVGFGLEVFATVRGFEATEPPPEVLETYGFESDGSTWTAQPPGGSASTALDTGEKIQGAASRRLDTEEAPVAFGGGASLDDAADWTGLDSSSVADDAVVHTDGSSSVKVTAAAAGPAHAEGALASQTFSDGRMLLLNVRLSGSGAQAPTLLLTLEDSGSGTTSWLWTGLALDTWLLVGVIPARNAGTLDLSDISVVRLEANASGEDSLEETDDAADWAATFGTGSFVEIADDATIEVDGSSVRFDISADSTPPYGESDLSISYDLSDPAAVFRFWFRHDRDGAGVGGDDLIVSLRSTGGTVVEAFVRIPLSGLAQDTWHEIEVSPAAESEGGGGDLSAIDQVAFQCENGAGADPCLYWLDDLRLTGAYSGSLIMHIDEPRLHLFGSDDYYAHALEGFSEDWSDASTFSARVRGSRAGLSVSVFLTDDTVAPRVNHEALAGTIAAAEAWETLEGALVSVGSGGDVSDVVTIGFYGAFEDDSVLEPWTAAGFGWSLWADDLRRSIPAANPYSVGFGTMLEHPSDVLRHLLLDVLGARVEAASFTAALTNLGSAELGVDLRTLGVSTEEILATLAYNARANLVPIPTQAGLTWRILTALASHAFPAAGGSITHWRRISEVGRELEGIETHWLVAYRPDVELGQGDALLSRAIRAVPGSSGLSDVSAADLTAAQAATGRRDALPLVLLAVRDDATADDVGGYYVGERIRRAALLALEGVPWDEAALLQLGDLREVLPPWKDAALKVRIIEITKEPETELVGLRAVEVL